MNKDPQYYLQKAEYFNNMVNKYKLKNEELDDYDNDIDLSDLTDNYSDEYEYELIKINTDNKTPNKQIRQSITNIKPTCKRYFDPVTRHYYRTEDIFLDDGDNKEKIHSTSNKPDIWYPENKLSFRTIRDPDTGKYYRINKVYDKDGNYSYKYHELDHKMHKRPGINFYTNQVKSYKCT